MITNYFTYIKESKQGHLYREILRMIEEDQINVLPKIHKLWQQTNQKARRMLLTNLLDVCIEKDRSILFIDILESDQIDPEHESEKALFYQILAKIIKTNKHHFLDHMLEPGRQLTGHILIYSYMITDYSTYCRLSESSDYEQLDKLQQAILDNDLTEIERLLKSGVRPSTTYASKNSLIRLPFDALDIAVAHNPNDEVIDLLLQHQRVTLLALQKAIKAASKYDSDEKLPEDTLLRLIKLHDNPEKILTSFVYYPLIAKKDLSKVVSYMIDQEMDVKGIINNAMSERSHQIIDLVLSELKSDGRLHHLFSNGNFSNLLISTMHNFTPKVMEKFEDFLGKCDYMKRDHFLGILKSQKEEGLAEIKQEIQSYCDEFKPYEDELNIIEIF